LITSRQLTTKALTPSPIWGPEGIGVWPHFDRDGDKISDLVEATNSAGIIRANGTIAYLNPIAADTVASYPSLPQGGAGNLIGGFFLPHEGIGYRHFYTLVNELNQDNYGTLRMVRIIEAVGREWNLRHPGGPRISIGDMSWQQGGQMCWLVAGNRTCHTYHYNGQDADVRYMRDDGSEVNYTFPYPHYSQPLTDELVKLFCKMGATEILIDPDPNIIRRSGLYSSPGCTVTPKAGHENHFHIKTWRP